MTTFNSFLFGTTLFGGAGSATATPSTDLVVFEGFSLADNVSTITSLLIDSGPSRSLVSGSFPRSDGQYITSDYWREKVIEVRGWVNKDTVGELEAYLDTMRKNLRTREGVLDLTKLDGEVRRYAATLVNADSLFAGRQAHHITTCPFTALFSCRTPFATDRDYTVDALTVSTSPTNRDVQNTGTIEAEPVVYLVVDAATSLTGVSLRNLTTGQQIEVTQNMTVGDVLKIDSERKEVIYDGAAIDFDGEFPQFDVGGNRLQFSFTATSADFTATIKHVNCCL